MTFCFLYLMVKKKFLPDEPDDWYMDKDSSKDIDLSRRKVAKDEQWINHNINDPDFQRLFSRVKGFYRGSCTVPVYVPDDLSPVVDRAMEKFKFSSKYEALLYILTLKSCEYVADFISGTMYDFAVDRGLADLSHAEIVDLHIDLFGNEPKVNPASFEGIAINTALSVASFLKYITAKLSDFSSGEIDRSKFYDRYRDRPFYTLPSEFPLYDLHALAVAYGSKFPDMPISKAVEWFSKDRASMEESISFERDRIKALIKEKVELQDKYDANKQEHERYISALRNDLDVVRKRASSYEGRIDALNREIKALKDEYEHGLIFSLRSFFKWLKRRFK